jgi:hypothetical protein
MCRNASESPRSNNQSLKLFHLNNCKIIYVTHFQFQLFTARWDFYWFGILRIRWLRLGQNQSWFPYHLKRDRYIHLRYSKLCFIMICLSSFLLVFGAPQWIYPSPHISLESTIYLLGIFTQEDFINEYFLLCLLEVSARPTRFVSI